MTHTHTHTHTPGPWTFDHDWRRFPTIFGADGNKVATIEKDRVADGGELITTLIDTPKIATTIQLAN